MNSNRVTSMLLYVSLGVLLFGSGYKIGEYRTRTTTVARPNYNIYNASQDLSGNKNAKNLDFNLFWETWNKLEEKYVDKKKLDPQKMYYGAIKGMAASVEDPYTFFLTPEENKQTKDDLGGKFEGIGAQLGLKDNQIVVVAPIKESPAEKAGIRAGDYIIKVDGKSTKGWTLIQTVSKIRGPKGTKVKLTIFRGEDEKDFSITRDEIHVASVELSYEPQKDCGNNCSKVALLKLNQFGENTNEEWDAAVADIASKWHNKQIKSMILDLRDNPGGYLEGAVYIASEFIPKGKLVVKQESTKQSETREYESVRNGELLDIPVVILINEGSASASEILSGALRDYNRATLVGKKSFGKGSVQEALDLQGGAGLHVTIAKWILPKGDWINGKGIEPKIEVENKPAEGNTTTKETDEQLAKAIEQALK